MFISVTKSKNVSLYYLSKNIYKDGKRTSAIVEKFGTIDDLKKRANGMDPILWAKEYAKQKTFEEKHNTIESHSFTLKTNKLLDCNPNVPYNIGYLLLENIFNSLQLDKVFNSIKKKYKFEYNLNQIVSYLAYSRILNPSSKISSMKFCSSFIDKVSFKKDDMYRALAILSENKEVIEEQVYKNSTDIIPRNTKVLYYDCTSFFFEIDKPIGKKQYGLSKENRPNPIIQMGLFMDGNGIPLAFELNPGNTNEQATLKPLQKRIMYDFDLANIVVCTDAGLSSIANRKFNNFNNRFYIMSLSLKKTKKFS